MRILTESTTDEFLNDLYDFLSRTHIVVSDDSNGREISKREIASEMMLEDDTLNELLWDEADAFIIQPGDRFTISASEERDAVYGTVNAVSYNRDETRILITDTDGMGHWCNTSDVLLDQ